MPKPGFPYEKLPTEVQLMVLRCLMPHHGLRAQGLSPRTDDTVYNAKREAWLINLREEDAVPISTFRANKSMSAQALDVFNREVYMHIDVFPGWTSCREIIDSSVLFPGGPRAEQMQYSIRMQYYQINMKLDDIWYWSPERDLSKDYKSSWRYSMLKESLRLVCDSLAANEHLQRLIVTIPCLCMLMDQPVSQALLTDLGLFEPLKRLGVVEPVKFLPAHGSDSLTNFKPCNRPECLHLVHSIQTSMTHLSSEALSHREKTWKRVKQLECRNDLPPHRGMAYALLKDFWLRLDEGSLEEFDARAKLTEQSLVKEYRSWELRKARQRREEEQRCCAEPQDGGEGNGL
ncbi:MAG: hypothetical protein Q9166_002365 [cf. Caloplaca sp. 2 TL-2023]